MIWQQMLCEGMNTELLSVDAKEIYDKIYASVQTTMFTQLKSAGQEAFDKEDYDMAIDKLTRAKEIKDNDYTVLNLLAHSYRNKGDTQNAIDNFQEIIDKFPKTKRANSAKSFIDKLQANTKTPDDTKSGDD